MTPRTIESQVLSAARNGQFLKVTQKNSGEGYKITDYITLTTKTFVNNPTYVLLFSCRLIGDPGVISEWMSHKDTVISDEFKHLIGIELGQSITSKNWQPVPIPDTDPVDFDRSSDATIDVYSLQITRTDNKQSVSYKKDASTTSHTIMGNELSKLAIRRNERKNAEERDFIPLSLLNTVIESLRDPCCVSLSEKVVETTAKKEHKIRTDPVVERVHSAASKQKWLDVSDCKENGSNIMTCSDIPRGAYKFVGIKELERVFFVPKRDTDPRSPTHNLKNVGALKFLFYFYSKNPAVKSKSQTECKAMFKSLYAQQVAERQRQKEAVMSNVVTAESLGIPALV